VWFPASLRGRVPAARNVLYQAGHFGVVRELRLPALACGVQDEGDWAGGVKAAARRCGFRRVCATVLSANPSQGR
jgi:hypothetical protein